MGAVHVPGLRALLKTPGQTFWSSYLMGPTVAFYKVHIVGLNMMGRPHMHIPHGHWGWQTLILTGAVVQLVAVLLLGAAAIAGGQTITFSAGSPSLTYTYDWTITKSVGAAAGGTGGATFTVSCDLQLLFLAATTLLVAARTAARLSSHLWSLVYTCSIRPPCSCSAT